MSHGAKPADPTRRALARDAAEAIVLAEGAIAQSIDAGASAAGTTLPDGGHNAFGERLRVHPSLGAADGIGRVRRAAERVALGERLALMASTAELLSASAMMATMASQRLATVFHVLEPAGAEAALALSELGWGLLFASDVEESVDLTLVARRAAEDSGTPFLVVHDLAPVRRIEPLPPVDPAFALAFVGPAESRVRGMSDPGHPSHAQVGARAFAERVPFALASALRELEALTGRKRDVLTRSAAGQGADASLVLVGLGGLGDILLGEVPRLRAEGHDVGAVKLTAFRPFPGPRLVRLLARALSITVLEHTDAPLAQSNALTREVKSAFADALTWAPDYPGIGRLPRVCSGVAGAPSHDLEARDLEAIVRNMLAGDHGKRFFVLGGDASLDLERTRTEPRDAKASSVFHMRGLVRDGAVAEATAELVTVVIARVLALSVRASIRPLSPADGPGVAFDLAAGAERPRGVHVSPQLALLVIDDMTSLLRGNPLARLGRGATVAVPTHKASPEAVWGDMPPYAKTIVFDRDARVVGWEPSTGTEGEARWLLAAGIAGVALAALLLPVDGRPRVDASLVEREVGDAVRELSGDATSDIGRRAGDAARRAFEASITVPRGLVERDEDAIRLGRKDARSAIA